jgi:hypothetical protein
MEDEEEQHLPWMWVPTVADVVRLVLLFDRRL